jgi:hypothetical protein
MLNTLKIDKSPGPDELHPRVLKEISIHNDHCLKLQSIYPILPVTIVKWNGQI